MKKLLLIMSVSIIMCAVGSFQAEADTLFIDEYNDVLPKTSSFYENSERSGNMKWEAADFGGEKALKAIINESGETEIFNWSGIQKADKVYIETKMGINGRLDKIPCRFGIVPVFSCADQTNAMTKGILFDSTRRVFLESETALYKNDGASVNDDTLYRVGYAYDRINKVLKAYYTATNGKTFVNDISSSTYAVNGCNIEGAALYQKTDSDNLNGACYYDYLKIETADEMKAENASVSDGVIMVSYNNVIDPNNIGTALLEGSDGTLPKIEIKSKYATNLEVTVNEELKSNVTYTLKIIGIKDLIGDSNSADILFTPKKDIGIFSVKDGIMTASFGYEAEEVKVSTVDALVPVTKQDEFFSAEFPVCENSVITVKTPEGVNYRYVYSGGGIKRSVISKISYSSGGNINNIGDIKDTLSVNMSIFNEKCGDFTVEIPVAVYDKDGQLEAVKLTKVSFEKGEEQKDIQVTFDELGGQNHILCVKGFAFNNMGAIQPLDLPVILQ